MGPQRRLRDRDSVFRSIQGYGGPSCGVDPLSRWHTGRTDGVHREKIKERLIASPQ